MSSDQTNTTPDDDLVARVLEAIHEGLGGNGWAYTDYGGDELRSMRDALRQAAREAIAVVRQWDAGK